MSISHLQNDTSEQALLPSKIKLAHLTQMLAQAPFDSLVNTLQTVLGADFNNEILGPKILNKLATQWHDTNAVPEFVDDEYYTQDLRFYEQIIHQDFKVPTRSNWHDFFNGLIWLQFPKTKTYFTRSHNLEISKFGVKQRTKVRDRITHFDECGLMLLTDDPTLEEDIAQHSWQQVFVERKAAWHHSIHAFIIGHALWEMLLNPFVGLTAKVKVCYVEDLSIFAVSDTGQASSNKLDELLLDTLLHKNSFESSRPWLPLPLLGVPGWSVFPQTSQFYANEQYFMPKNRQHDKTVKTPC